MHIGGQKPETIYAAVYGAAWGYRNRARLSVRLVPQRVGSWWVPPAAQQLRGRHAALRVLPPSVSELLPKLHVLIAGLSIPDRIPQIEIAVSEAARVLVFRILLPLSQGDEAALKRFAEEHGVQVWLQPGGPDTASLFHPSDSRGCDIRCQSSNLRWISGRRISPRSMSRQIGC